MPRISYFYGISIYMYYGDHAPAHLHAIQGEHEAVCGPHSLRLAFNDGTTKGVDVLPLLHGPVLEPLRDAAFFSRVVLDPACGTVVWANGADFAPEALHAIKSEQRRAAS